MRNYIAKRLLTMIPTLLGISIVIFLIMRMIPGDTITAMIGTQYQLTEAQAEAMRAYSMRITPRGMLSRGTAALRKSTLIINLPGSPKAVRENLEAVTPALTHGIEILVGAASNCAVSEEEKEKAK